MRFVTDFPGGNGSCIRSEAHDWGWEVEFLAQSKAREPQPLWFFFRLEELTGEKVRIKLANSYQCLCPDTWLDNHPVCRQENGEWQRVEHVEETWTESHRMDTWFEVPLTGRTLEFAFCYPYQQSQLMQTLVECPAFQKEIIGYSAMGRPIWRVYNAIGKNAQGKQGVYFLARQHSGEVTGTWVMDGILRYLSSEEGKELRDKFNWWFVPMVDIDGVEEGFYGKDQIWKDLNRAWHPSFPTRPELVAVQKDLVYFRDNCGGRLMLDLHGPAHRERDCYFTVAYKTNDEHRAQLRTICAGINRRLDQYGRQHVDFIEKQAGSNTSSQEGMMGAAYARYIGINGCALEINYQGERNGYNYEIGDYRRLGEILAKAVADMLAK